MEFEGTEGKWEIGECVVNEFGALGLSISSENVKQLATVWGVGGYVERAANAHLIAAAPELFEAAIKVIKWTDENISKTEFAVLRQAINKALNK